MTVLKIGKNKLQELYSSLMGTRSSFLTRAEDLSRRTLPHVLPKHSPSAGAANKQGYQGIGAEAVNHLSNKMVSTLFPVSEPFFAMTLDPVMEQEARDAGQDKGDLAPYWNALSDNAMRHFIKLRARPLLVQLMKHLVISGNGAIIFTDNGLKMLGLDKYVVKRDTAGNLLKAVTKEKIAFIALPKEMQTVLIAEKKSTRKKMEEEDVALYTGYIRLDDGTYDITQSVESIEVMEPLNVSADALPFIAPRWNVTSGEDYGRGLCEDHEGDLHVLEFLSEARAKGAATMMDVKYLVRPGALTDVATLNAAPTGEFVQGMEDDISVLQLDKYADGSFIKDVMTEYQDRIGRAFLMLSASVRDSERTTKYEIQKLANELDVSLGGVYSSLADELQRPMAFQLLDMIDDRLIEAGIEPLIMTGLEALGRAQELEKIMQYSEMLMMPTGWPEQLQQQLDWDKYSDLVASQLSLDVTWFKDPEKQADENNAEDDRISDNTFADSMAASAGSEMGKQMGQG